MAKDEIKSPAVGEKTKAQGTAGIAGILGRLPGFSPALLGTYKTYRKMRNNPTIALARAVATAPVRLAKWGVVVDDDIINDDIKDFIQKQIEGHWRSLIKNMMFALDYGWAPFEKVWEVKDGKWVYKKLKPLLVDKTSILTEQKHGTFAGLRNGDIDLPIENSFLYTYDGEAGYLYGRSRHENIRESSYNAWEGLIDKYGQYVTKISGIIPIVEYPEGISNTEGGAEQDNFEIAKKVLQTLGSGFGVTMPNVLISWAEDAVKSGVDISKLKAWTINFLETKGQHGTQFVGSLRHNESLMMRGWLVPERTATEGQHGTKAESKVQGDIALMIADLLFEEILEYINWYLVNPLLIYNFGQDLENKVRLERAGPDPETRELLQRIFEKVLSDGNNTNLLAQWIDIDASIDAIGLPKAEETLNTELLEENKPTETDEAEEQYKDVQNKLKDFVDGNKSK